MNMRIGHTVQYVYNNSSNTRIIIIHTCKCARVQLCVSGPKVLS